MLYRQAKNKGMAVAVIASLLLSGYGYSASSKTPEFNPINKDFNKYRDKFQGIKNQQIDLLLASALALITKFFLSDTKKSFSDLKDLYRGIKTLKSRLQLGEKTLTEVASDHYGHLTDAQSKVFELIDQSLMLYPKLESAVKSREKQVAFLQGKLGINIPENNEEFEAWRKSSDGVTAEKLAPTDFIEYDRLREQELSYQKELANEANKAINKYQDVESSVYKNSVQLRGYVGNENHGPGSVLTPPNKSLPRFEPSSSSANHFKTYVGMFPSETNAEGVAGTILNLKNSCSSAIEKLGAEVEGGKVRLANLNNEIKSKEAETRPRRIARRLLRPAVLGGASAGIMTYFAYESFLKNDENPFNPSTGPSVMTLSDRDKKALEPLVSSVERQLRDSRPKITSHLQGPEGLTTEEKEALDASVSSLDDRTSVFNMDSNQGIAELRMTILKALQDSGTEKFKSADKNKELFDALDLSNIDTMTQAEKRVRINLLHGFLERLYNQTLDSTLDGVTKPPATPVSRIRKSIIETMIKSTINDLIKASQKDAESEPSVNRKGSTPKANLSNNSAIFTPVEPAAGLNLHTSGLNGPANAAQMGALSGPQLFSAPKESRNR